MLIIQIAAGIVLGGIILIFLEQMIVALGYGLLLAFALVLGLGVLGLAHDNPELTVILIYVCLSIWIAIAVLQRTKDIWGPKIERVEQQIRIEIGSAISLVISFLVVIGCVGLLIYGLLIHDNDEVRRILLVGGGGAICAISYIPYRIYIDARAHYSRYKAIGAQTCRTVSELTK